MKNLIIVFLVMLLTSMSAIAQPKWLKRNYNVYITDNPRAYIMQKAFKKWQLSTNKFVTFNFVESEENADITADFVEELPGRAVGICYTQYVTPEDTPTYINKAKIHLARRNLYERILTNDEYYRVMLHEIGHALGLPHSEDANSIMKPYSNQIINISISDRKNLEDLYK